LKLPVVMKPSEPLLRRYCTKHNVSHRAAKVSQLFLKFPADLDSGFSYCKIQLSYYSHIASFWMNLCNCRCFQEHLRILLHILKAQCVTLWDAEGISNDSDVLVRSSRVPGWLVWVLQSNIRSADVASSITCILGCSKIYDQYGNSYSRVNHCL
jgi:hypothetical protein